MEHSMAVGDVLAVLGSRDVDGDTRQYVVTEHGGIGVGECDRTSPHFHLVEMTDLTSGYTMVTDMHIADVLVINSVPHRWVKAVPTGFVVAPAS